MWTSKQLGICVSKQYPIFGNSEPTSPEKPKRKLERRRVIRGVIVSLVSLQAPSTFCTEDLWSALQAPPLHVISTRLSHSDAALTRTTGTVLWDAEYSVQTASSHRWHSCTRTVL